MLGHFHVSLTISLSCKALGRDEEGPVFTQTLENPQAGTVSEALERGPLPSPLPSWEGAACASGWSPPGRGDFLPGTPENVELGDQLAAPRHAVTCSLLGWG